MNRPLLPSNSSAASGLTLTTSSLTLTTQPGSRPNSPVPDSRPDAPLLPPPSSAQSSPPSQPARIRARRWQLKTARSIVLCVSAIKFTVTLLSMLIMLPFYRLMQDVICHGKHNDDSPGLIDERKCLADNDVQAELAYFLGFMGLVQSVLTLLCAFPYGIMADRLGRKPTATLAYFGLVVQFTVGPVVFWAFQDLIRHNPWILVSISFLTLIGGGIYVLFATLYAVASDVSSETERASSFLYLTFGSTLGGLVGPLLSGVLLQAFGPWVPIMVVFFCSPLLLIVFALLPETSPAQASAAAAARKPLWEDVRTHARQSAGDFASSLELVRNRNVLLVLVTFFLSNVLIQGYSTTLALYVTRHFGWTLAQVSYLLSSQGVLNLAVLAGLPVFSKFIIAPSTTTTTTTTTTITARFSRSLTSYRKDLVLARASLVAMVLAAMVEAVSPSIALFVAGLVLGTLGAAHSPLCRAVITAHVPPARTSRLYALISTVEIVGSFFGGPVLAWWFDLGLRRGGMWRGACWGYIAVMCGLALVCLMVVGEPQTRLAVDGCQEERAQREHEPGRYRDEEEADAEPEPEADGSRGSSEEDGSDEQAHEPLIALH